VKNILITGITGFVGSHLADLLLKDKKNKIFGLKRPNSQLRNIHHIQDKLTLFNGDLTDQTSLIELIKNVKPEEIYHLGALSWVTPSWDMPASYMQTNAVGTINLFEAMRNQNCKAKVFISCTPEEFGDVPEEMIPITEETRIHPINPYAASKAAQDMVSMVYYASYGIPIIRTRAFNHEGPRRDILGANASFAFQIARIERGLQEPVIKVGNLEATRNFTDVIDLVKAYVLAMEKGEPSELYLIGSQNIYTMKECLDVLISFSTRSSEIVFEVDPERVRPTELKTFIGDFKKFRDLTGWEPTIKFEETMLSVLNYWRNFIDKGYY
ncbi:GDP-mannose 4,6-dehydratase, partial [Prochlorococcus sp. AH-716-P05]|nr:GDP-mannose 4,6-dehydratase [Prochlorococcus sp. AH-716-P05]